MLHLVGFSGKLKLCPCSALVFQHIVMLLLLIGSHKGDSQGVGSSETVVALIGDDVILPCHLEPAVDAVSKSVEWGRPDLEPRFIHVWHNGQNLFDNQNPSYKGRTSVSTEKLKHGDLSLTLTAVRHSDNGIYRCYFPSQDKESTVKLVAGSSHQHVMTRSSKDTDGAVLQCEAKGFSSPFRTDNSESQRQSLTNGFFSQPVITRISKDTNGVVLQCEAKGWYPEPEVLWRDEKGKVLSAGPKETTKGPDDLFTVRSRLTVEESNDEIFTCQVHQKKINQTRETHILISGYSSPLRSDNSESQRQSLTNAQEHYTGLSSFLISLAGGVACGLLTIGGFFLLLEKCRSKTSSRDSTTTRETSDERKPLLQRESKKIQEERTVLGEVLAQLMDQKDGLQKQVLEFRSQVGKIENEKEKNKQRIREVESNISESERRNARDQTEGYLREKQALLDAQDELDRIKEELQEQQLSIERLQQRAERMIGKMTECHNSKENEEE